MGNVLRCLRIEPRKSRMKRTPLRKRGKSESALLKRKIQAKVRELAIERDKTCVIGKYPSLLPQNWILCGSYTKDGKLILQAEHLVSRANTAFYADMDNILLVCSRHHLFFKQQCGQIYWDIVRKHLGEEHWEKVQMWARDRSPHKVNLQEKYEELCTHAPSVKNQ